MMDTGEAVTFLYWFGWTVGVFLLFVGAILLLSIFQVFWKKWWGDHDE